LYIAHFLGSAGANRLISAAIRSPDTSAATLFPDGARANRSIFYNRDGSPRSVAHVYNVLVSKHQANLQGQFAALSRAASTARVELQAAPTPPAASDRPAAERRTKDREGPVFHSLFSSARQAPVSPVVAEMWSNTPVRAGEALPTKVSDVSASARVNPAASNRPLDLFQFLRPEIRAAARA
jgi:hypothetical protein